MFEIERAWNSITLYIPKEMFDFPIEPLLSNLLVDKTKDIHVSYNTYGNLKLPLLTLTQDDFQILCLPEIIKSS